MKRSIASGLWFVGRHIRGLWVKTCAQSPPIASIRSIAVSIPPAEDLSPELHRSYDRARCPSASAWLRARPASSTSAACARFLFNWLFARQHGGECRLRIENTDTSREVAESVEQIQESLRWLGIDWDGPVTFQLDRMDVVRELGEKLVAEGKAYMDEGAIRFRQPEGVVGWDDAVRGRIEFEGENLSDLIIVRTDGRPTYNFASPVEDMLDEITHVIRGNDHVSNTPTQINILRALGAELPVYAHVPDVNGNDGKKLSKRHGAVSIDVFRADGYLPAALMNFLALLGWSYDDKTTVMSPPSWSSASRSTASARARRRSTTRSSTG